MSHPTQPAAIVTGGAGHIGQAIAAGLAADGFAVAVADLDLVRAQAVADRLAADGRRAIAVAVDVCSYASAQCLAATVLEAFGAIDVLVNNAGGSARLVGGGYGPFHEAEERVIAAMIDINLKGPLFVTRAVAPYMVARRQGRIVQVGSICGVQGTENVADYSAAKGGVIAFTKALAKELGAHGILVNCVSPGLVPRPGEELERARQSNYLGRACTAEDVAELVRFLAGEKSGFITGHNHVIDGGRSLAMKTA
ncbi:MAG: SDR family oxidoreductase [Planctomycetes bacterium]|nr:SDR family oxidoreductase [Planctomycetota bacterium]